MSDIDTKLAALRNTAEDTENKRLTTTVKNGLQNKTVQVSMASVAAIAACGAVGYALTRPRSRRRISRYTDQISSYLPGLTRKTSRRERLANQIVELIGSASRR